LAKERSAGRLLLAIVIDGQARTCSQEVGFFSVAPHPNSKEQHEGPILHAFLPGMAHVRWETSRLVLFLRLELCRLSQRLSLLSAAIGEPCRRNGWKG
jgi:hypothetical protein